jgi:Fe2+ transport system protein FeoA
MTSLLHTRTGQTIRVVQRAPTPVLQSRLTSRPMICYWTS